MFGTYRCGHAIRLLSLDYSFSGVLPPLLAFYVYISFPSPMHRSKTLFSTTLPANPPQGSYTITFADLQFR